MKPPTQATINAEPPPTLNTVPTVALETALLTHGLPRPLNVDFALELESIVRDAGAHPRTVGVVDGRVVCGLPEADIRRLGSEEGIRKLSLRDLPVARAKRLSGGTTVAATLQIAASHGVGVFATGGIGGVHRDPTRGRSFDVSADLLALARYPVCTVCAGAKAILDLEATVEVLETSGVTVLGYGVDEFPAFYSRSSGLPVDYRVESPRDVANVMLARIRLGMEGCVLVAVPIPEEHEVPRAEIEPVIERSVEEAMSQGLRGAAVTPFLLRRMVEQFGDRALDANLALLRQNARVAAEIAIALDRASEPRSVLV